MGGWEKILMKIFLEWLLCMAKIVVNHVSYSWNDVKEAYRG